MIAPKILISANEEEAFQFASREKEIHFGNSSCTVTSNETAEGSITLHSVMFNKYFEHISLFIIL